MYLALSTIPSIGCASQKNFKRQAVGTLCFVACFLFHLEAQTVIGGTQPNSSAMLDVQGTSKGVLFPRLTSGERVQIINPATGLMIFNTSTRCLEINLGTSLNPFWQAVKCPEPGMFTSLNCSGAIQTGRLQPAQLANGVSVTIPYSGGNGGAFSAQEIPSTGTIGLTARLPAGFLEVGAGNLTLSIEHTAAAAGLASFALSVGGQSCTFNIPVGCGAYFAPGQWKEFMCHNLGSFNFSADPFMPSWEINGGYWQWGTLGEAVPGPTGPDFGDANIVPNSWNGSLNAQGGWTDLDPMPNNPCPAGYRVPTLFHLSGVWNQTLNPQTKVGSWSGSFTDFDSGVLFGSALFLPAAGLRGFGDGLLSGRNGSGFYWSSTEDIGVLSSAYGFTFDEHTHNFNTYLHSFGGSIRCMKQ